MIRDAQLERVLSAERAWAEAMSRTDETTTALSDAIGDVPSEAQREDEIEVELAKLNVAVQSMLARVHEFSQKHLNSIGDDAQLANVDLQNVLQKQQQTLQMLSNMSKSLHDTAKAVIRKIGG
jgi:multidrug resistance efflux pump